MRYAYRVTGEAIPFTPRRSDRLRTAGPPAYPFTRGRGRRPGPVAQARGQGQNRGMVLTPAFWLAIASVITALGTVIGLFIHANGPKHAAPSSAPPNTPGPRTVPNLRGPTT